MTDNEKIEGAADFIQRHVACDRDTALYIARAMYNLWRERVQVCDLAPGEVAKRFRERYER